MADSCQVLVPPNQRRDNFADLNHPKAIARPHERFSSRDERRMMTSLRLAFLLSATCLLLAYSAAAAEPSAEFARDVKPLLERSCFNCHGPKKQRSGLRLDTAAGLSEGGDSGPVIVPGDSGKSRLVQAVTGATDVPVMPPKGPRLTEAEVGLVRKWIDQGAKVAEASAAAKETHWSFRPVRRPDLPIVKNAAWVRNSIDAFVLARLEKEGIAPASEADRPTLLRRLSLDLIGLPPTPEEVDAFVKDARPDVYERVVDRLLASPHYGERWGRHWLDLARYADSNGYSIDSPRTIWPYRDWVIHALNRDLPFDQFTIEQLAGDLLPDATTEQKVATGFHRNTQINEEGGVDKEQFRVEAVVDRVNTTGSVWLGLTVGCCQCHSHKFDPLSQRDYYQLFAFFNNQDEPNLTLGPADPSSGRGPKRGPAVLTTMVLQERKTPRESHVLIGGDFTRKGMLVTPGTPSVLPRLEAPDKGTLNRLDLARWLVAPENPLTSRVLVNRIWGQYFGLGLVETENDFGTQGTPPSHPELLDWLASEVVRQGWSLKPLHRLIVTSETYRQSSNVRPELATVDPRNRLLARQARLRLEAEVVRDVGLAASGLLDPHVGGPSVFPPQPEGVGQFTQIKRPWVASDGPARYRRGLYTYFWRASPHPALTVFDAPDAGTTCTRRNRSNTPLQALTLLNDAGFSEPAYGLAVRLLREGSATDNKRVRRAFRLCLGREPDEPELRRLAAFLAKQQARYAEDEAGAAALLKGGGPAGKKLNEVADVPDGQKAALVLLARVLLNLDEFITRE
jgi:mono/diheme cytochrome c family protein